MEESKLDKGEGNRDLIANLLQVSVINKMMPIGYKFELFDTIKKQSEQPTVQRGIL